MELQIIILFQKFFLAWKILKYNVHGFNKFGISNFEFAQSTYAVTTNQPKSIFWKIFFFVVFPCPYLASVVKRVCHKIEISWPKDQNAILFNNTAYYIIEQLKSHTWNQIYQKIDKNSNQIILSGISPLSFLKLIFINFLLWR